MKENNSKIAKIEVVTKKLKVLTERLIICCISLLIPSAVLQFASIFFPDLSVIDQINILFSLAAILMLVLILVSSLSYIMLQSKVKKSGEQERDVDE